MLAFVLSLVSCQANEGITPLMEAAEKGDSKAVKALIIQGAEVDKTSRYGWTALMFASRNGHADAVKALLDAGADPNLTSRWVASRFTTVAGYPPTNALYEALAKDHSEVAKQLLAANAEPDALAVAAAGKCGDLDVLEEFKRKGADFNRYSGNPFNSSALEGAIQEGNIHVIRWLLENEASPDKVAGNNTMHLETACRHKRLEIAKLLIEKGANPNPVGGAQEDYNPPLMALFYCRPDDAREEQKVIKLAELLIEAGANLHAEDEDGMNLLKWGVWSRDRKQDIDDVRVNDETIKEVGGYKAVILGMIHEKMKQKPGI